MPCAKSDLPVKIDAPGAIARQMSGFGDTDGCGTLAGEYFSLAAGADIAPLLVGLDDELCHAPHWGYLIEGEITVTSGDGSDEDVLGGDLFHWPPGHTVRVSRDAEVVLFSPQREHGAVIDHMFAKMRDAPAAATS